MRSFFVRPRRFGKSLFVSMMQAYYDRLLSAGTMFFASFVLKIGNQVSLNRIPVRTERNNLI